MSFSQYPELIVNSIVEFKSSEKVSDVYVTFK